MNRSDKYFYKMEFILEKINILPSNLDSNPFLVDALFYRFQVSIDAAMDIVAMLCKDFGILVNDDYSNIDELVKFKVLSPSLAEHLRKLNGLRNALVHKYNKIEEDLLIKEKENVVAYLNNFVEIIKVIIDEKLNIDSTD